MAQLGFRTLDEMIGRVDRLDVRAALDHWKARGLDFSAILHRPDVGPEVAIRRVRGQDHGLERSLDATTLVPLCRPALETRHAGRPAAADPQRAPDGGDDPRLRGDVALRRARAFPTTRSASTSRDRPARASAPSSRAASRWCSRATPTTTSARGSRAARSSPFRRARRRSLPRTTSWSATSCCTAPPAARRTSAGWPASGSPSATAARSPWSRASATTAAST